MRNLYVSFIAFHLFLHASSGQEYPNGVRLIKHTIGYAVGYAYPKLADGSKHTSVASDFNYGFSGAFEWGKHYDSGISFLIAPSLYYYNVDNTVLTTVKDTYSDGSIKKALERDFQFDELLFTLPLSYEFPLFKNIRFGGGAHISFPLKNAGSVTTSEIRYFSLHPPLRNENQYEEEYHFETRLGVSGKLLCKLHSSEKGESYLGLEYWYDVDYIDVFYAHNTKFALVYTYRYLQVKEVREKWDRVMLRKYHKN